jgi:hypothetical protein
MKHWTADTTKLPPWIKSAIICEVADGRFWLEVETAYGRSTEGRLSLRAAKIAFGQHFAKGIKWKEN